MVREKDQSVSRSEAEPGNALQGVTRRQALSTIIGLGAAALPVTRSILEAGQAPQPPKNLRIVTPPSSGRVVTPNDLRFVGFYRFPGDAGSLWWADAGITMRKKDGQTRFFIFGDHTESSPIIEMTLPNAAPSTAMDSAPLLSVHRNWGPLPGSRIQTGGTGYSLGSLSWDETRNALWWNYGDAYVPVQHHPNFVATVLNDSTGAAVSYGPWRTEWLAQRTLGAMCQIPAAFAAAYTGGHRTAVMAHMSSGAIHSPWGASLSSLELPNPATTPPDTTTNTSHWTIRNRGIILHDIDHRQSRDTRYRYEDFNVKYDCSKGVTMQAGIPLWGGPAPGAGTGDSMHSMVWIDLPDKHGLLYFGMLVTTPSGYSAPADPEGLVHMGYAALPGSPPRCCHGQDDPFFGATGPWAHYRVPMGWIYNPDDLVATTTGKAALHSRVPTSTFAWKPYLPWMRDRYAAGIFGRGAVFDAATRRVYATLRHETATVPPHPRPVILVFEIA